MATIDGEAAQQLFFTLPPPAVNATTLLLPESNLFDCCSDFKIDVLANDGVDNYQNDVSSFLNLCTPTTTAAVFKLYKDNVLLATLSGTTYGIDYTFGFKVFSRQKMVGYKIQWYKVLALHGQGIYKIELSTTDALLGNLSKFSNEYKLCTYRPYLADETVRIDWWQNGTIGKIDNQKQVMNYADLNWHNQLRFKGFFGYPETEMTSEFVKYWNGIREWVKNEQEPIYKIKTRRVSAAIQNLLRIEIMMSDRCSITDYNSTNAEKWQDFEIFFESAHKPNWKPLVSKLSDVELLCKQRYNNLKKRRY
jgi:hypothetical protein